MNTNNLSIATITWARTPGEENLLRQALEQLSAFNIPVFVTDGGSNSSFIYFVKSLPNFTLVTAEGKGLWPQVQSSLQAAYHSGSTFILYTEPDKKNFFDQSLAGFIKDAAENDKTGIVLAGRSANAFETFPLFQRTSEATINFCCSEITGHPLDYTYGPFLLNRKLVPYLLQVKNDIGWGWRPYSFCIAHHLGYQLNELTGNFECPDDQRTDDAMERIYRMKQLSQSIDGIVVATDSLLQ